MRKRWYVVQSKTKQESIAQQNLENQNFKTYFPQYLQRKIIRKKLELIPTPLFPAYLFVEFDISRDKWRAISGTRGVLQLVTATYDRVIPLPENFVEDLSQQADVHGFLAPQEAEAVLLDYLPGQPLKITDGIFKGLTGTCINNRRENVVILLALLSGNYTLELPKCYTTHAQL